MIAELKERIGIGCVRVSTDRQERSISEQKDAIRKAAERDGVTLLEDGAWCEDEGISGSILDRPGLRKLLGLCGSREDITDVYFWKRNRLARSVDPLDGMKVEREIEKCGKRVHFIQGIQRTGNRLVDFIASGLEYAEAGQYLVNLSADTTRGLIPLTKQGFDAGRPTPYGFDRLVIDRDGNPLYTVRDLGNKTCQQIFADGHVQTYTGGAKPIKDDSAHSTLVKGAPDRVAVIRRIFESYVYQEKGIRTVVEELNAEGIPSPRGKKWSVGTIRSILVNPIYTGANIWNVRSFSKYHRVEDGGITEIEEGDGRGIHYHDKKNWIVADEDHGFDAIISRELFDLAQAKRKQRQNPYLRGKAVTAPYYLSGLAKCICGHNLHGHTKTSSKAKGRRKYPYYTCGGFAMKGKTVCERYLLPTEDLEKPIFDALSRRLREMGSRERIQTRIEEELNGQGRDTASSVKVYRDKIADAERKMRRWEAAIDEGLNLQTAAAKLNDLARQKEALERRLRDAEAAQGVDVDVDQVAAELAQRLDNLDEVLRQGSVAEVKSVLRAYIGRIKVDPHKKKARIGFLKIPIRAFSTDPAARTARISMVAGGGFEPPTFGL